MKVTNSQIPDVKILEPKLFQDERGFFMESYNKKAFQEAVGREVDFVQDNHSKSCKGSLRGLHYQIEHPQAKLVRVTFGEVYDVAVDMRKGSPTFGKWVGMILSADNKKMLWIPEGFAHGFLTLSEGAEVVYKATDYYFPEGERSVRYDDPELGIVWPIKGEVIVSEKDRQGGDFRSAELFK